MPNEEKQNKIYENLIEELEEQSSVFLPQGISYELNIFAVRCDWLGFCNGKNDGKKIEVLE